MSLQIASLNTGSNGNCFYIGNNNEAVLIDVGLSCRETEKRMERLALSMDRVKAIFISHEHSDHIKGLPRISQKFQLPVYITPLTQKGGRLELQNHLVQDFKAYQPIEIGDLKITAFPKKHDAAEPHSFVVSNHTVNIGVFTDIGQHCDHVIDNFKQCHAVFLEANYDEEMLNNGHYPYFLKNRIRGGHGHLSNQQALELFLTHRTQKLSHVFLSHLSKDNNCPDLVHRLFSEYAEQTEIVVASRHQESSLYTIG